MTDTTATALRPGDRVHALRSVAVVVSGPSELLPRGDVIERGRVLTLSADLIAANSDRNGRVSFEDPELFGRGDWPENEELWIEGSIEHELARKAAYADAVKIVNDAERGAALREVVRRYGRAVTSHTDKVEDPSKRDPMAWR